MNKSGIRGDNDYEVIGLLCLRFDFITFVNCSYSVSKTFTDPMRYLVVLECLPKDLVISTFLLGFV